MTIIPNIIKSYFCATICITKEKFKKKYNNNTLKNDIYVFFTTESKDKIDQIFNNIQTGEDDAAVGHYIT
ncbi:unnamed protein product [Rhizophagus irregularis]|nr:unnamed protein product [Rhizophagus irregularis]